MTEWRYADQILRIDLTTGLIWVEETPIDLKREFVGGAGFVAALLAESEPGTVALATGPLSDRMAGRLAMGAALPGEGEMVISSLGGRIAGALKDIGYDAVVLSGALEQPGLIVLDEGEVRVVGAADLWGRDVLAAESTLVERYGGRFATLVIGPAGEERVPHATLAHEGHYAGGGGIAAAFGAMLLKGMVVRDRLGLPGRCTGCTLNCAVRKAVETAQANLLGLDARVLVAGASGESGGEAGPARRRRGPGLADLLGTCQRTFRERPGQVLREALSSTLSLTRPA